MTPNEDFMTAEQVAQLLNVDRSYILQLCRAGLIDGAFKLNPSYPNSAWVIPTATAQQMKTERERNTNAD